MYLNLTEPVHYIIAVSIAIVIAAGIFIILKKVAPETSFARSVIVLWIAGIMLGAFHRALFAIPVVGVPIVLILSSLEDS